MGESAAPVGHGMVADEIDGNHLLLRRIRAALLWILLSLSLFTLADVLFGRPGLSIGLVLKLVEVVVLFVAYQRARLAATDREIRRIALLSVCVLALITVAQGVASGDALTTALLLLLLNLGTATLFPWGAGCQLVTALTTAVCLGLNSWIAHGQLFGFGIFPALGGIVSLIGSVFLAYELDRYRRAIAVEMSRRDRSEAEMRRQRDELREAHRLLEQRSERRFRTLIEKSLDLVSIVGPDGRYLYANPVHASVFGIEPQQLVGRSAFELTHPDDLRRLLAVLEEGVRAGLTAATVEYRLRHHDGAWHFYEGAALNLIDDPHVGGILVTGRDITQRELAKERRTLLLEFAQDIRGNFELDELLTRVQTRAAKLLSAEGVITHRWQPQDQCYRAVGDYGLADDLATVVRSLRFGAAEPYDGRLLGGETIVLNEPEHAPPLLRTLGEQFGVTSLIAAPLGIHGRHLGSLTLLRFGEAPPFCAEEAELCTGIAGQLAMALETLQLQREQREEGQVSAAMARVGHELIAALDRRELLDRLCAVTAEVLGCDVTYTVVRRPDEPVYRLLAAHGVAAEDLESARVLTLPLDALAGLVADLSRQTVVEIDTAEAPSSWAAMPSRYGIASVLYTPLRRGDEIIGVHAAGYREARRFTELQYRIAGGIAELASIGLEQARLLQEIERASRLKSEFLATMSHELRTPLNVIAGYTELMLDSTFGTVAPEQVEVLQRVRASGRELIELIDATLDMSRLESGRIAIDFARVDLNALLSELAAETRMLQERSGLSFRWPSADDLPAMITDRMKLKVVLKNLIGNAVKFTAQGEIAIDAVPRDGGIEIAVRDTGVGIAPQVLPIIFEAFRQGDSSFTRPYGGVGLGLYIVRRLLGLLGGSIAVESEIGKGSLFRVWLPDQPPRWESASRSLASAVESSPQLVAGPC